MRTPGGEPMSARPVRLAVALLCLPVIVVALAGAAEKPEPPSKGPEEFKSLKFRLVGPAAGGRVARVAGVPGDPRLYFVATASGGVWKPVFDDQPDASIGSIAVSPSDPAVVYVGAGEANIRGNVGVGHGIYKSTD